MDIGTNLDLLIRQGGPMPCLALVIGFIAFVGFLSSLTRAVNRVEPENRRLDVAQIWLNLIPVFNLLWMVVTIERIGESLRNEFMARGRFKKSESYGKSAGLGWLILADIGLLIVVCGSPCGAVFWPFAFIYWVVYWAQISGHARRLAAESEFDILPKDEGW
jgi:hypothetical protein